MKFYTDEGKCLRCGKKLSDQTSIDSMVGPECKGLHWNPLNTVKTVVSISSQKNLEDERNPREFMEEMEADILFACKSKEYTWESQNYTGRHDVTEFAFDVEVWVRAEKFCTIITSGYEDKFKEAVELSPIIKIGDLNTYQNQPNFKNVETQVRFEWVKFYGIIFPDGSMRNGIIEALDLNEQEFAMIPNSFDDWNEKILSPFKVNVKRILFQEEFIVKMKTMEFIYCDPIVNAITGDDLDYKDNYPANHCWEFNDNPRLEEDYWAEQVDYNHDVYCDAVLCLNHVVFLPNLKYRKKEIDEYDDGLTKCILRQLEKCYSEYMEGMPYWYDDSDNFEYFNQRVCWNTARTMATNIGQCIGNITQNMPEKPEIELTNVFEGLKDKDKYWSWVKGMLEYDYYGFGNANIDLLSAMKEGAELNMSGTPWGNPDGVEAVAPGIDWVITGRHGGLRVSNAIAKEAGINRLLASMASMQKVGLAIYERQHWWFEEDCAWSIAVLLLPEHFSEESQQAAEQCAERYFPEAFALVKEHREGIE